MSELKKDSRILVLRVNNFASYTFVDEHKKAINKHKAVWMLKVGRELAEQSIEKVMEESKKLIIKEPKHSGNHYYLCNICEIRTGEADSSMTMPKYYQELKESGVSMTGTWIKIDSMKQIPEKDLIHFELVKSGKKMTEVINCTRSPVLFVQSKVDLSI